MPEQNKRNATETAKAEPAGPKLITRCLVCNLPQEQREAADRMLRERSASLGAVARQFGINKASVARHASNHLLRPVTQGCRKVNPEEAPEPDWAPNLPEERSIDTLHELDVLYWKARAWLTHAEHANNWQATRALLGEARKLLQVRAELKGERPTEPQHHVMIVLPGQNPPVKAKQKPVPEAVPKPSVRRRMPGVVIDLPQ